MDSTITVSENNNSIMNKLEPFKKTGLGERLKSAREALQLTEKEVALRLHLNVTVVSLIESEDFAEGPPATFMRGYLRSYAKLLNLPESEIKSTLKELEAAMPSSTTPIPMAQVKPPKDNERYLHWLTYVIVVVLIVLVSVWWSSHSRYNIADVPTTPQPTAVATPAPAPAAAPTPTVPNSTAASPAPAAATVTTTAPPAKPEAAVQPTAPLQAAPGSITTPAAPATPTAVPIATTAPATPPPAVPATETKKSTLSNLKMALPEPDVDAD